MTVRQRQEPQAISCVWPATKLTKLPKKQEQGSRSSPAAELQGTETEDLQQSREEEKMPIHVPCRGGGTGTAAAGNHGKPSSKANCRKTLSLTLSGVI